MKKSLKNTANTKKTLPNFLFKINNYCNLFLIIFFILFLFLYYSFNKRKIIEGNLDPSTIEKAFSGLKKLNIPVIKAANNINENIINCCK